MKFLITILSISFVWSIYAQVLPIEQYRFKPDSLTEKLLGSVDLSFESKKQVNNVLNAGINTNMVYIDSAVNVLFITNWNFQKVSQADILNHGFIHLRFVAWPLSTFNIESFSQAQYDIGLGLNERYLTGLGVRKQLIDTRKTKLSTNMGFMYEHEFWTERLEESEETTTNNFIKSTINFTYTQKLDDRIYLFVTAYHQARPEKWFKPRIVIDSQLEFKVTNKLSAKLFYASTYDAIPVVEIAGFYYTARMGFSYKF